MMNFLLAITALVFFLMGFTVGCIYALWRVTHDRDEIAKKQGMTLIQTMKAVYHTEGATNLTQKFEGVGMFDDEGFVIVTAYGKAGENLYQFVNDNQDRIIKEYEFVNENKLEKA